MFSQYGISKELTIGNRPELPVTSLKIFQRVGILNNKRSVPIITNPTTLLSGQSKLLNEL